LLPANATPAAIAERIKAFYTLAEEGKEKMRRNALSEWQKNYSAEVNYRAFIEILKLS
jgi:hypothetical protein